MRLFEWFSTIVNGFLKLYMYLNSPIIFIFDTDFLHISITSVFMHVFGFRAAQKTYPNIIFGIIVLVVVKSSGAKAAFNTHWTRSHKLFIHFSIFDSVDHFLARMVVDFSSIAANHVELGVNFG